ncbi:MAG TPA: DUF3800 domain-containing protein [Solirubrobacterales bacterium]|nr:DUF3800 domain-containing protein [Solirubrobacterales bacterium]
MRFAYMDETGNTGRRFDDRDQPIHMILSLVVDESRVADLHEHMREIGRRHCPDDCEGSDFEFHGGDLFSGAGLFARRSPEERIQAYDDVLRGIELAGGEVIVRGVHKAGLDRRYANPYHPHDVTLMFTIESIERMARECDCQVLLVADEAKEVEDAALRDLVNYQELGTRWGWRTEKIERIIDTIHFVPSHRNCAIQLADCATYIAARVRKMDDGTIKRGRSAEAVDALWETRIAPYVRINEVWYPA